MIILIMGSMISLKGIFAVLLEGEDMGSQCFFSLDAIKPQNKYAAGSIISATGTEVPGFMNISFSTLNLQKGGSLEPIWHPNAHKIGYCLAGNALVSIRCPDDVELFLIKAGDIFFIPKGYIHHVANLGDQEAVIHFALNHTHPQWMRLSQAVFSLSDSVFDAVFNTSSEFFYGLKKTKVSDLIKTLPAIKNIPPDKANSYKFNLGASHKTIQSAGGYLQVGTKTNLPVLDGLGILGFGLKAKGVVEPHWHTNAGELVYIVKGKTRITVLSPDGKVDVLRVNAGQGAFAAASYFHNIENVGEEDVQVIAYFSDAQPDYIGIGEVIGSYSNELLSSVFDVQPRYFDQFYKPQGPLVIVPI